MLEQPKTSAISTPWRPFVLISIAALIAIFLAFFAGIYLLEPHLFHGHSHDSEMELISAQELEQRFGLQVTLIGVTAGGGLVDFRFKIVDEQKARLFLSYQENMPMLIPASGDLRLGSHGSHSTEYQAGKVYYMLFGNSNGVVRRGDPVSVAFGNLILESIIAQ
jgi:hypothetical protein